jgi:hypothetical protein
VNRWIQAGELRYESEMQQIIERHVKHATHIGDETCCHTGMVVCEIKLDFTVTVVS